MLPHPNEMSQWTENYRKEFEDARNGRGYPFLERGSFDPELTSPFYKVWAVEEAGLHPTWPRRPRRNPYRRAFSPLDSSFRGDADWRGRRVAEPGLGAAGPGRCARASDNASYRKGGSSLLAGAAASGSVCSAESLPPTNRWAGGTRRRRKTPG